MRANYKICLKCHKPIIVMTSNGTLSNGTPYYNWGFWKPGPNSGPRQERYTSWSRRLVKADRNHVFCHWRRERLHYMCDCDRYSAQTMPNSSDPYLLANNSRSPCRPQVVVRYRISQNKIKPMPARRIKYKKPW